MGVPGGGGGGGANPGFADQSINSMFASARDQIARSLLK